MINLLTRKKYRIMIRSKAEYKQYLAQDKKALGLKDDCSFLQKAKMLLCPNLIWEFEKSMRKVEYIKNVQLRQSKWGGKILVCLRLYLALRRYWKLSLKLGFSIPVNTFGPGLSIAHYGTIIVNDNARIGANCRLHCCVNIGASKGSRKAPQIGNNVYIGPSSVLFGDIIIADNVTIGANATVNKSFEQENVVLAGSPAKIVKENCENWLEFNNVVELQEE